MSLEIEVEPEVVKKAFDEAYKDIGRHAEVPGFRKGKAPRSILEKYLSEERVAERAAERLAQPAFEEALKEAGLEPFGEAEYEIVHLADAEPFKFKAKVPLPPSVELGNYTGVEVEKLVPAVSDEDIERELESIRQRSAEVTNVEGRPIQKGDLVILRMVEENGEERETVVEAGNNLASFDAGLMGMSVGETKSIEVTYPEDFEDKDLAGKKYRVTLTVNDIKERHVPELTDELARKISEKSEEKIESVDKLKDKIREAMEKAAADIAERQVEAGIVDKIVEGSKIHFPDVVLEHEVERRFDDLLSELKSRNMTIDDYLSGTSRTFEQLHSQVESAAARDLRISLALGEIAKKEDLQVSEEDVEAEIAKMAEEAGAPKESVHAYLDKTGGRRSMENRILRRKVLDFLVHASNIKHVGRASS